MRCCPKDRSYNISDTPPQLIDATILFVNFSTEKKDAFIRICIVDERIGITKNKIKL
jgi:hypothetical protein